MANADDVLASVRALRRARDWHRRQNLSAEALMRIVVRQRLARLRQALAELDGVEQLRAFCIRVSRRSPP